MGLKFSFPEIPYRSQVSNTRAMTTINHAQNLVKGDRSQYFACSSNFTSTYPIFDINSGATESADHCIIARADKLWAVSGNVLVLYKYNESTLASTLIKTFTTGGYDDIRSQDQIETFTSTSGTYFYLAMTSSASTNYAFSKCYLGLFFELDQNPIEWTPKVDTDTTKPFATDSGREYLKQTDYPRRTWFAKWTGITNAKCEAFYNKCAPFLVDDRKIGLFLYDDSGLNEFFGASLQHVWMYDINIERVYNDYNTITCTFMEQIG